MSKRFGLCKVTVLIGLLLRAQVASQRIDRAAAGVLASHPPPEQIFFPGGALGGQGQATGTNLAKMDSG